MPVAGTDCDGIKVQATAGASSLETDFDIEYDAEFGTGSDLNDDSDYGWDLSLDEDVLQLLNSAAALAAEPVCGPASPVPAELPSSPNRLLVPVVTEATQQYAAITQSLGSPLLAPAILFTGTTLQNFSAVGDDDPRAAVLLDETVLGTEADCPTLSQPVAALAGENSSDDDFESKGGKYTAKPYTGLEKAEAIQSVKTTTSFTATYPIRKSPLVRFRTAPSKPLSVSDLVAGAWCELQYEYTLTRLPGGRPRRNAAMKAGTSLHKKLEDQVHTVVPVAVTTKEDLMAVRIFNMIQGLSTLREIGLTREFNLVGVLDTGAGTDDERYQVVNGVIDALSYEYPDLEDMGQENMGHSNQKFLAGKSLHSRAIAQSFSATAAAANGSRITDYFASSHPRSSPSESELDENEESYDSTRKIYVSDVKTRESLNLPSATAARPSRIQLFLYHRFLSDLAAGRLSFSRVFKRLNVDPLQPLSPSFLADLTTGEILGDDLVFTATNLDGFVDLLNAEVAKTFPKGADSIGEVVAIEYRQRASNVHAQHHGRCLGTVVVPVDRPLLDRYLSNYLEWWRGLRPAAGVDIEDAGLKCRHCDFAVDCDWRMELDQERMDRARAKMALDRAARAEKGLFT
ncbi:hypothetical protein SEPCBS57363_001391 [Sporothrix epigloea]|uniref:Defects in morphology protein 1 n=1 Tax=Sporothrix epigloea TaxID=1892477 RepID=A0ABP0DB57_9PEZI